MEVTPHIMEVHRVTRIAENCAKELEPDFTLTLDPAQPHYPIPFPRGHRALTSHMVEICSISLPCSVTIACL